MPMSADKERNMEQKMDMKKKTQVALEQEMATLQYTNPQLLEQMKMKQMNADGNMGPLQGPGSMGPYSGPGASSGLGGPGGPGPPGQQGFAPNMPPQQMPNNMGPPMGPGGMQPSFIPAGQMGPHSGPLSHQGPPHGMMGPSEMQEPQRHSGPPRNMGPQGHHVMGPRGMQGPTGGMIGPPPRGMGPRDPQGPPPQGGMMPPQGSMMGQQGPMQGGMMGPPPRTHSNMANNFGMGNMQGPPGGMQAPLGNMQGPPVLEDLTRVQVLIGEITSRDDEAHRTLMEDRIFTAKERMAGGQDLVLDFRVGDTEVEGTEEEEESGVPMSDSVELTSEEGGMTGSEEAGPADLEGGAMLMTLAVRKKDTMGLRTWAEVGTLGDEEGHREEEVHQEEEVMRVTVMMAHPQVAVSGLRPCREWTCHLCHPGSVRGRMDQERENLGNGNPLLLTEVVLTGMMAAMPHLVEVGGVAGVLEGDRVQVPGEEACHPEEHQEVVGEAGSSKDFKPPRHVTWS
uniref:WD repeat domain 33 n=1 Tax=Nothobranchius korthausae TaxID=1143690 RepID=A0A1A8GR86_9TELE